MLTIAVEVDADGVVFVSWRSPTDERLFHAAREEWRRMMPSTCASYNGSLRAWRVSDEGLEYLRRFVNRMETRYHAHIEGWDAEEDAPAVAAPAPVDEMYRVLYLQPDAPPEVVRAAFNALSELGGDAAQMQRINAAYTEISRGQTGERAA